MNENFKTSTNNGADFVEKARDPKQEERDNSLKTSNRRNDDNTGLVMDRAESELAKIKRARLEYMNRKQAEPTKHVDADDWVSQVVKDYDASKYGCSGTPAEQAKDLFDSASSILCQIDDGADPLCFTETHGGRYSEVLSDLTTASLMLRDAITAIEKACVEQNALVDEEHTL